MALSCGIIGLPNVGKSTLFNALTATAAAQAENYPFCTIEPNLGEVAVPDARLEDYFPGAWIRACCENSLRNLGTERIDVLQLHVWADAWTDRDEWYGA